MKLLSQMIRRPVAVSIALLLGAAAGTPAFAQDQENAAPVTEVVVTGSRIPQPNLTSTSPIQVVSDKEIALTGTTDMISLLNTLPQQSMNNVADFSGTSQVLAAPGGVSTADLRGLGPQRTLVLVDGRRLGLGDANTGNNNPAPDLNQIPVQLIQRVDVVTGGASTVYGSDAIAGVVNFIMKHDFEGVQVDAQYGFNNHHNKNSFMQGLINTAGASNGFIEPKGTVNDGYNRTASIILGANGAEGKSNATVYFTYLKQDPVSQGNRDFSACKLNVNAAKGSTVINVPSCNGSINSNLFEPQTGPNAADLNDYSVGPGQQFVPNGTPGTIPGGLFNSNPYQYLEHADTRYAAGVMSHYDFNDSAKVYGDFSFMNDKTTIHIGPSGAFAGGNPFDPYGSGGWQVNCNNPLLSGQEQGLLCDPAQVTLANANAAAALAAGQAIAPCPGPPSAGQISPCSDVVLARRNVEGIGRTAFFEHINYRGVIGIKGDIVPDAWSYDAYAQYYYTSLLSENSNYLSNTRIGNALQVDPNTGQCVVGAPCVPWNIFTQQSVTPDQLAYLLSNSLAYGTVQQEVFHADVTAELGHYGLKLPGAEDGVGLNFGVERRVESLAYQPDETSGSGDLGGGSGAAPTIANGFSVNEAFVEARVPILHGVTGAQDLVFETGYRYSDYSTAAGKANSFKFGLQWAPIQDIRFRASFQRAIRAPNIIELFNPATVTQTSTVGVDPCATGSPTATAAACLNTGVSAAQYGHVPQCPAGQCSALEGGNSDLQPEVANTTSLGFTVTPAFLPGFTGSVDYYRISLKDQITTVPVNILLALCLDTGLQSACSQIHRGPNGGLFGSAVGSGGYFQDINANIAEQKVEGIDVQLGYRKPLEALGTLDVTLAGSYLTKNETTPLAGFTYDCSGLYGITCQTVNPKWRHNLRVSWQTPIKLLVSVQWRFIGSVSLDTNDQQPALKEINKATNKSLFDAFDATLGRRSYIDLSAFWDVLPNVTIRGGISNLFDKDPPLVNSLVSQTGSPNTYPTYDLLGRVIFIGAQAKF